MGTHAIGKTTLAVMVGFTVLGLAAPGRSQQGVSVQLFQFKPGQLEVKGGAR